MKFSLFVLPNLSPEASAGALYETIAALAQEADTAGWEAVWVAEHHFDPYGGVVPSPAVLLGALAAYTRCVRLGAGVAVLPLGHPLRLAEDYAMVDALSGGRLEMGVGRGFVPAEFRGFGVGLDERRARFEEALEMLVAAWCGKPVRVPGAEASVAVLPAPTQRPHPPVWMAVSTSRESFELAGKRGFNLMLNPYNRSPDELDQGLDWYRSSRAAAGLDRHGGRVLAMQHLYVAPTTAQARDEPREALLGYLGAVNQAFSRGSASEAALAPTRYETMYPGKVSFGTPDEVEGRIRFWEALGITDLAFMTHFGDLPLETSLASMRLFSREVAPRFRPVAEVTPCTPAPR